MSVIALPNIFDNGVKPIIKQIGIIHIKLNLSYDKNANVKEMLMEKNKRVRFE